MIPYYIFLKDEELFSMAGIPFTDYIHNTKHRMPAILSQEDEKKWTRLRDYSSIIKLSFSSNEYR